MGYKSNITRRHFLKQASTGLVASSTLGSLAMAQQSKGTLNFADIGVGDPGGDWTRFSKPSGWGVNLVAIGNGPSQILNVLLAGSGKQVYDVINIVGGMQKPLVDNDLIVPLDTKRMPNWANDSFIREFLAPGKPGFDFIGYKDKIYGVPTILQGDSMAYLPDVTGPIDSYAALFDPKWKGFVALEDNYTTALQKTALYLSKSKLATIKNPDDMTPGEVKATADFLIEKKKEGQFRVIWTSFEQAVDLLVRKEVYVMDAWEPMVFAAKAKGVNAAYARPKEGYLLWAMAAYIVKNPSRTPEREKAIYDLLNFMLGGWYGAKIALLRGYMTNPLAAPYAKIRPSEFTTNEAIEVARIHTNVRSKFKAGGTWQNRWPTNVDTYESEWARFKAAPSR